MNDLSPHAVKELEFLAQVRGAEQVKAILTIHQPVRHTESLTCLCGWAELGKSFPGHQAEKLREEGVLK
jgi:hypothetical protein